MGYSCCVPGCKSNYTKKREYSRLILFKTNHNSRMSVYYNTVVYLFFKFYIILYIFFSSSNYTIFVYIFYIIIFKEIDSSSMFV